MIWKGCPLLVLSVLFTPAFAVYPISLVQKGSISEKYVPNQFIVEMADTQSLNGRSLDDAPHGEIYQALRARDVGFQVQQEYNQPGILIGAVLTLKSTSDVQKIVQLPSVTGVRPVLRYPRPELKKNVVIDKDSTSKPPVDSYSTHVMTGVDKVHAKGNFGQGIKIGIIDTGIDYQHSALGGGFGDKHKVAGGYDFVGDNYDGQSSPIPDDDPLDKCAGHGTHVAGIIGANPNTTLGISGVAYRAELWGYRVFGCEGGTTDPIIIDALIRGFVNEMDVMSLSLGGSDGWTEGMASVVASRIAATGTVITIAAGNSGQWGAWYTSSPGNGIDVISVASIENAGLPAQNMTVNNADYPDIYRQCNALQPYLSLYPLPFEGSYSVYATSNDTSIANDACKPLPDNTPDLSDRLVLMHRGGCDFVTKLENAAEKGGKRFLIYNSDTAALGAIVVRNFQAALIQAEDGKWLVQEAQTNPALTVTFPQVGASSQLPNPNGGLVNDFSSYGPTFDMYMKPALAAPGGDILSTFLDGGYAIESGTSMATPFVAGAAALLLKAKGKDFGRSVQSQLQMTAVPVSTSNGVEDALLQTAAQQGAGLIQVDRAIYTTTVVGPAQILLNDTAHDHSRQHITITNQGKRKATYYLTHIPAGTALTFSEETNEPSEVVSLSGDASAVKIERQSITIGAGQTVRVPVVIPAPVTDLNRVPVYSGYITITDADGGTVHSTYLGAGFSLKERKVLDDTDHSFGVPIPALINSNGDFQLGPQNYTLKNGDAPSILARLIMGTAKLSIDLVQHDIKFTPTIRPNQTLVGRGFLSFEPQTESDRLGTFEKVKTVGKLADFRWLPRNTDGFGSQNGWNFIDLGPNFANETAIPQGQYRILVRALKIFGKQESEADYESWLSPIVGVVSDAV